jgi:hypothetical protein
MFLAVDEDQCVVYPTDEADITSEIGIVGLYGPGRVFAVGVSKMNVEIDVYETIRQFPRSTLHVCDFSLSAIYRGGDNFLLVALGVNEFHRRSDNASGFALTQIQMA